jgi:hypothetical protein
MQEAMESQVFESALIADDGHMPLIFSHQSLIGAAASYAFLEHLVMRAPYLVHICCNYTHAVFFLPAFICIIK